MATQKIKTAEKPKDQTQQQAMTAAPQQRQVGLSFEQFVQEFDGAGRQREITAMLPESVPFERFRSTAIAAVKQNPEILTATPRSVFNALTKAAQDGLLPDGREGFINVYNTKHKIDGRDVWLPTAQWMPMTHGIRKRARELDELLIDAQVVYQNDRFEWHQGDDPKIIHVPTALGQSRGEKVGAYAIFKRESGTILHREVMDYGQIGKLREHSKSPDGLLWKKFEEEAFRKSVVRRGSKTVPVSDKLRQIFQSDDDAFDFTHDGAAGEHAPEGQMIPPRPQQSGFASQPDPKRSIEGTAAEKKPEPAQQGAQGPDGRPEPPPVGEEVQHQPEAAQAAQEAPQPEPEPARETVPEPEDDDQPPSEAFMGASNWLDTAEAGIMDEKDLDDLKKRGRGVIDSFEGLTPDELDMLRGRFTTMCLVEQQRRGKKKR